MISLISGKIYEIVENKATILTSSGVGYLVWCTNSLLKTTAANSNESVEIIAYIQTIVKEEEISLYGFYSAQERDWFNKFLNIQGVGAKMALLILNSLNFSQIINSLVAKDHSAFQQISGIGPKLAKRLVNEVNTKNLPAEEFAPQSAQQFENSMVSDAEAALISLGFGKQEIKLVLGKISISEKISTVEDLIKYSLGALTTKK